MPQYTLIPLENMLQYTVVVHVVRAEDMLNARRMRVQTRVSTYVGLL